MNFEKKSERGYKILCLGAHCDDIEIGCGGTLIKWIEKMNIQSVKWVVFSSNAARAEEARKSAELFLQNVPEVDIVVKDYNDGFLPYSGGEIKQYFEELKQDFSPDIILTHYRNDLHQDHRLISELTWNTYRSHFILEYEIPKYDGDLGVPNFFVYLDEHQVNTKAEFILKNYLSQKSKHWFEKETFISLMRLRGMESASPTRYSEAFYARKIMSN